MQSNPRHDSIDHQTREPAGDLVELGLALEIGALQQILASHVSESSLRKSPFQP